MGRIPFVYKLIAYSSIAYMHFWAQIKILETELLLPICIIAYTSIAHKYKIKVK